MKSLYIKSVVTSLVLLLTFAACTDFDELNTNPDGITSANPETLAAGLILGITRNDINTEKSFMALHMISKYILWSEFPQSEQYNDFGRTSFVNMTRLIDADKMVEFAESTEGLDEGIVNSYRALRHFMRAYTLFDLTMRVGDIPYSDALKGEAEANLRPGYDTQKEVFLGILDELDEANRLFTSGAPFDGDMIYGGDPVKWQKMVNSFALKVLINLYKKTGDGDLRVKERFNEIANNRSVMEGNEDNFSLKFENAAGQMYPFHELGNQFVIYPLVSDILIDKLKELEDYRLFYYTEPSPVQVENGLDISDYEAYKGVAPSMPYSEMQGIHASKDYSDINKRYKEVPKGEPVFLLSYAQVQFILAEAAVRGWISGDAETYYREGIRASMYLVADNTPGNPNSEEPPFHHNRVMDKDYIDNYYANTPTVQLAVSTEEQLEQIITQKFLCTFLQSPLEPYFENRRTGYPHFPINPETNENVPADKLPVRWLYPQDELNYNSENVNEAIDRQYNGNDNVNELMWILKD
ncbi:SusD/RagB family nutrient-binding outer membrane lipoprotein [Sinomicrobium weinanense]|uniref:SusD/RagB family nutrient-binding outer membrane lipoprotein n=1 Tax=Sinomicrobium weinanense TaxID=2842200 RepID=A0A926Q4R0_9FLAO|nr:SusD/RagB family nutrient-binding outer membrane lipoprotein [Sinomicrobium weinanense]MBC9797351.1 SusD/RagB family nutrient-binding outer membrane lipoprotein [Sinomicrobium weinanense]MBU3124531.1 SusD/RagB family nutrient-binding outer membrane lipoprotein [Sinomicrobium weinanense]